MESRELQNLCDWKRRQAKCLLEIGQLTDQLADALGRRDQVSVDMLLAMRQEPIGKAQELDEGIKSYLLTLSEEDAIRCSELLGGGEGETPEEKTLAKVSAQNRRTLERIREVDRRISLQVGGRRSFYESYR